MSTPTITLRIEGAQASGKTALSAVIQRALVAHGLTVEIPPGRRDEINASEHDEWSRRLTSSNPRVGILEDIKYGPTLEDRIANIEARLAHRGMRDVKFTLADSDKPRSLGETVETMLSFLEAYVDGRVAASTTIEIDPKQVVK